MRKSNYGRKYNDEQNSIIIKWLARQIYRKYRDKPLIRYEESKELENEEILLLKEKLAKDHLELQAAIAKEKNRVRSLHNKWGELAPIRDKIVKIKKKVRNDEN